MSQFIECSLIDTDGKRPIKIIIANVLYFELLEQYGGNFTVVHWVKGSYILTDIDFDILK